MSILRPTRHPIDSDAGRSPRIGNLDDLRRSNLSTVLSLVHVNRSLSRSDITKATGLNRSTVATIVTELEELGLVSSALPQEPQGIGRPSSVISPSDRVVAIAVNPELDATTLSVVSLGGRVLRSVRFQTERIPTAVEVVNAVSAVVAGMYPELEARHVLAGISLAIPGLVRAPDGLVKLAPHLGWVDEPIVELLARATGLPVFAGNDATAGVVAESLFGAGRDHENVVYLNGGASGIGAGVVAARRTLTGASGYGGELGHLLVNSSGIRCHCGAIGCLETEVTRADLLSVLEMDEADVDDLDERLNRGFAEREDVRAVVERQLGFLTIAIRNVVNAFNPERVILGGFLSTLHAVGGQMLDDAVRETALPGASADVQIVASALGRDNLHIGAAELAFAELLRDPVDYVASRTARRQ